MTKISFISLAKRLANGYRKYSEDVLIQLIETIQNKPQDMSCEDNAKRLMNIYYSETETPLKIDNA